MTLNVLGYAALAAKEPLVPHRFERRDPRPDDVVIQILYCGICHTDVHHARNDWGRANYPLVPGHEIIGKVVRVGAEVTRFKPGDHVGVGCMVDSCRSCPPCQRGHEQHCEKRATMTYNDKDRHDGMRTFGGYADSIVCAERFVLSVPNGLDLAGAAPLLCAGITTWAPLRERGVRTGSRVAVVGLGGLGHMAVKLAKALGASVTLFTRSAGKEQDARRLGADDVVVSTDTARMATLAGKFELIVDTVPSNHDLNPYIATLATGGALVLVGFLGTLEPALNTTALVIGRKAVAGSMIGGIADTQEMLEFCARHRIASDVEVIAPDQINAAYERMLRSDVKYRFVIDLAKLTR
jgi:uncharacterized zinc-type alcohol dehydrogenase-like protein